MLNFKALAPEQTKTLFIKDSTLEVLFQESELLENQRKSIYKKYEQAIKSGSKEEQKTYLRLIKDLDSKRKELHLQFPNIVETDPTPLPENFKAPAQLTPKDFRKPHWELFTSLGWAEFSRGWVLLKGPGAQLQRKLISFFLEQAHFDGYLELTTPHLAPEEALIGTAQIPDKESQLYRIADSKNYLIPTGEVTLTNWFKQFDKSRLETQKICGHTVCWRKEAGSWGLETKGLQRLHEFHKVERVILCSPERVFQELHTLICQIIPILTRLGLQYRVVSIPPEDLGFAAATKYDLEVWAPGQQRWLEVSSCSQFRDFQTRRMDLRMYQDGILTYPYTINGSAFALPRIMAALVETHQRPDGTVDLPL